MKRFCACVNGTEKPSPISKYPYFFLGHQPLYSNIKRQPYFSDWHKAKKKCKNREVWGKRWFRHDETTLYGKIFVLPLLFNRMLVCRLPIWPRTLFCSTSISFYSALSSYFVSDSHMHKCVQSYSFQKLLIILLLSSQRKELLYCSYGWLL